jgi:hypothetical protein
MAIAILYHNALPSDVCNSQAVRDCEKNCATAVLAFSIFLQKFRWLMLIYSNAHWLGVAQSGAPYGLREPVTTG